MLVQFHLPPSLFSFLHNYSFSFIYLQNIIPTDYIPTHLNKGLGTFILVLEQYLGPLYRLDYFPWRAKLLSRGHPFLLVSPPAPFPF